MTINETHIRELLNQATPGPWEWWGNDLVGSAGTGVLEFRVDCGAFCQGGMVTHDYTSKLEYDQKLIELAPELARDWLRMRREFGYLERMLEDFADRPDAVPADAFAADLIHQILNGETNV